METKKKKSQEKRIQDKEIQNIKKNCQRRYNERQKSKR